MRRVAMLVALLMALATVAPANAEEAAPTKDERWAADLKKIRQTGAGKAGVAVLDVQVTHLGSICRNPEFLIGRVVDGKMKGIRVGGHRSGLFKITLEAVQALNAGEYFITSVKCSPPSYSKLILNGAHARFDVRAGEVVNLGTLRLEYKKGGSVTCAGMLHRSVEPLPKETVASVNQSFPRTFALAVNRPMKVLAPVAETRANSMSIFCNQPKAAS